MKKSLTVMLAAWMLLMVLAGCGSKEKEVDVDLTDFFDRQLEGREFGVLMDLDEELTKSYYPGLEEYEFRQFVAKAPAMSAVVNEFVFAQCMTEEDAKQVAQILQKRVDGQAQGDAFYPESIEGWKKAKVIQTGPYVAMIASLDHQGEIEEAFRNLFT